jgi:hypothetical protein
MFYLDNDQVILYLLVPSVCLGAVVIFIVVGFTTIYAISAFHCEFEFRSLRGVLDTTLCDEVCQWLAAGRWFSPGPPVSSINKSARHDIAEILLKVTLNIITVTLNTHLFIAGYNEANKLYAWRGNQHKANRLTTMINILTTW